MAVEYVHPKLNEAVESIGGTYAIDREITFEYDGRKVLAALGVAVVDKSCCGTGGCRFANVAGYVTAWKVREDAQGRAVSEVEPVADEKAREEIRAKIEAMEPHCQVNFQ